MHRRVAFLRAINVGGRNVKMERLRELFESLGFGGVQTFIASGNVVFNSGEKNAAALERQIEEELERALGFEVATFIRTTAELPAIAEFQPFPPAEIDAAYTLSIAFLKSPPHEEGLEKLADRHSEIDDFHVRGREVYWLCHTRASDSRFSGAVLERTLGMPATFRNVTTVRKLAEKYGG